ncbi:uncharacterized protein UV8b_00236 [Ustilaginoidea virens]|uniref:Uncharacterized protein n=1 Tax=Ustilaginoidea virens TaxID=1159556 RepID=A0A8E5HID1_USTVR|nr:uncharacterized protein UV8b_00236 [Ustilaginoidea virens]QUC15995.1 hypothetical protein UV8b_00236 [Ustilaginoidea virens]
MTKPESRSGLTFEQFLQEVSRRRKRTSPRIHKRQFEGEINNSAAVNLQLLPFHQACHAKHPGSRSIGGNCIKNAARRRAVNCRNPAHAQISVVYKPCAEGEVCNADMLFAYNFNARKVKWPLCVQAAKVAKKEARTDPNQGGEYAGEFYASRPEDPAQSDLDYHLNLDLTLYTGPSPSSYGRFRDTAGHTGSGSSWSCFSCPPGLVTIHAEKPSIAYGYVM